MPHLTLGDTSAYHEVSGRGEPLLLMHGGFCSIESMRPQIAALSRRFRVYAVERPGHGRTADQPGPYSYDEMLAEALSQLDRFGIEAAHLFGFSDGAIVGLKMAIAHPDRVRSLVLVGANLSPDGVVGFSADDEDADLASSSREEEQEGEEDEITRRLREDYGRLSPDGADHAEVVIEKLLALWESRFDIAPGSLAAVDVPTLVMAADRDLIETRHTLLIADSIPGAQLCIVPGASHMMLIERPDLINRIVDEFHATLPANADGDRELRAVASPS